MLNSPKYDELSTHFGMTPDYFVVGDGSGTLASKPCGYFAWVVGREGEVEPLWGACSRGSNNFAEVSAMLLGMTRVAELGGEGASVVCVSDSQVTVRCAKGEYGRNANLALWAGIDYYLRQLDIEWVWKARNSVPALAEADGQSRAARLAMERLVLEFPQEGALCDCSLT